MADDQSFFEGLDDYRAELYAHNFWDGGSVAHGAAFFSPTPFENQAEIFTPYERGVEFVHDVYSIFYKPLVLIYTSSQLLLQSGVFAVQCVSSILASLVNLLPSLTSYNIGVPAYEVSELLEAAAKSGLCIVAAVMFSVVCLPIDLGCSILSAIIRPMVTGIEAVAECFDEEPQYGYRYSN